MTMTMDEIGMTTIYKEIAEQEGYTVEYVHEFIKMYKERKVLKLFTCKYDVMRMGFKNRYGEVGTLMLTGDINNSLEMNERFLHFFPECKFEFSRMCKR